MNFDMRNHFPFHHSGLCFESNTQARRHDEDDFRNKEGSYEKGILNEELCSEESSQIDVRTENLQEKMLTVLTGKNNYQRIPKDKAVNFSQKLMYVLTCGDYDHIVHWKTNQAADSALDDIFVIEDIDAFTSEVLPSLFKMAKYESFQRKLYRWGFLKIYMRRSEKSMKRSISYTHPLFEKGDFELAAQMTCSGLEDDPVPMRVSSILSSSRCLNPSMPVTNPEDYFSGRDFFSIRGNCNFSTHERIGDCHSIAHNRRITRSVQFDAQTFNGLSIDQILENAYSVLRE